MTSQLKPGSYSVASLSFLLFLRKLPSVVFIVGSLLVRLILGRVCWPHLFSFEEALVNLIVSAEICQSAIVSSNERYLPEVWVGIVRGIWDTYYHGAPRNQLELQTREEPTIFLSGTTFIFFINTPKVPSFQIGELSSNGVAFLTCREVGCSHLSMHWDFLFFPGWPSF